MPLPNGKLRRDSTIVFRIHEKGTSFVEPAWMSRVVVQVAKASKVMSMISFDLETLEELGCEFHQQVKRNSGEGDSKMVDWEPEMESFTTFLEHFFEVRGKQEASQRNQQMLSTILDATKLRQTARCPTIEERDDPGAFLIHIMDCDLLGQALTYRFKQAVLARIAEMVRARREQGEAVAILLSTSSSSYLPGDQEFKRIGATRGSIVAASRDKILDWDQRIEVRKGIVNTQRLRRLMRRHLPSSLFCSDLLNFSSDWNSADRAQTYKSFGKKLWSSGDVEKAIAVLGGRGWRISKARSQMSFADICDVLQSLSLFHHCGSDYKSQATEEPGEASESHFQQPKVFKRF